MNKEVFILGAGVSGLSAGIDTDVPIYEADWRAGGISVSYYVSQDKHAFYWRKSKKTYRFEIGGGHWIFGADKRTKNFINRISNTRVYRRNSAVYFPDLNQYVPHPLQENLSYLPNDMRERMLKEIFKPNSYKKINTFADWLEIRFGKTLCELFFFPFHNLYTDGIYTKIAYQDNYKTPLDKRLIEKGKNKNASRRGYNATFVYPEKGLDNLIRKLAKRCKIKFSKKVVKVALKHRELFFEDGTSIRYKKLISTLPLNKMMHISGLKIDEKSLPFTSVLVINIGAKKGKKCPPYHWVYIPKSKTGFYRVGFYSNIDTHFLPLNSKCNYDKVSIYVEKAYREEKVPTTIEIERICKEVIKELKEWGYIEQPEIVHPTWADVAYTWEYPNSQLRIKSLNILRKYGIYQIGRYGNWRFQGIAHSIREGLGIRKILKNGR